jgi:uncharacterized protein YoxC
LIGFGAISIAVALAVLVIAIIIIKKFKDRFFPAKKKK